GRQRAPGARVRRGPAVAPVGEPTVHSPCGLQRDGPLARERAQALGPGEAGRAQEGSDRRAHTIDGSGFPSSTWENDKGACRRFRPAPASWLRWRLLGYARNMQISDELFAPVSPGIELCYQTFGDPDDEPLLLVMGLGAPMTWWNPDLCAHLARAGFFVVRFDNREAGRSSVLEGRVSRALLVRAFAGAKVRAPYSIADLAGGAFGLLDDLGLDSAHVVGASMGGMIVQSMVIAHPERVRSLTSIMSTTGKR